MKKLALERILVHIYTFCLIILFGYNNGINYMFFRICDFAQTDGMRANGGRDYYRETLTHSAELSPNFV